MAFHTPKTIDETLREVAHRHLVLPAIQREFVWRPSQIRSLFDSIMQGYPFGTLLYWRVDAENSGNFQFYDFVLNYHQKDNPHCTPLGPMYNQQLTAVLDGQQRLTALNIGLALGHFPHASFTLTCFGSLQRMKKRERSIASVF